MWQVNERLLLASSCSHILLFAVAVAVGRCCVSLRSVSSVEGYTIDAIHGFVEELIMEKDPEYHWVDSFRASRTSNFARQLLFNQLTGKVRRNVGRKAIELGNARHAHCLEHL